MKDGDWKEGEMCIRCKTVPILDSRMPLCSGCRDLVEKQVEAKIADRKNRTGKNRRVLKTGRHKLVFKVNK